MKPAADSPLAALLACLPNEPGVYLMKNAAGRVLYVGKAKHLRHRVRSYFVSSPSDERPFVQGLAQVVTDIETILTHDEQEALLLETTLIRAHKPRFNIKIQEDPDPWLLRMDPRDRYPRLEVVRHGHHDGARYFGSYDNGAVCRKAAETVSRHFKLRTCSDEVFKQRTRPCWQYHIKRCDAPCVFPVSTTVYAAHMQGAIQVLQGKNEALTQTLQTRMAEAVQAQAYECAAMWRDQLQSVQRNTASQRLAYVPWLDQDAIGWYQHQNFVTFAVMLVRQGKLVGREVSHLRAEPWNESEVLLDFVQKRYSSGAVIPDEVVMPLVLAEAAQVTETLSAVRKQMDPLAKRVRWVVPQRGLKRQLVALAHKNAAAAHTAARVVGVPFVAAPLICTNPAYRPCVRD